MPDVFFENFKIMGKNLFFAFIPLLLSIIIFKKRLWQKPSLVLKVFLSISVVVFYFFLPNAPYVLTDIIHMVRQIKDYKYFLLSDNLIIVLLIPQYMIFMFIGFSFYVIAFQEMLRFLIEMGWNMRLIWLLKVINPVIMGIGIFLGRVRRFNSWDLFISLDEIILSTLKEFSNLYFIMFVLFNSFVVFIGFEILTIFYKSILYNLFNLTQKELHDG